MLANNKRKNVHFEEEEDEIRHMAIRQSKPLH